MKEAAPERAGSREEAAGAAEQARWARTQAQQAKLDARAAKAQARADAKADAAEPAKRRKYGGRKRGSINKKTLEKIALAEREITQGHRGKKFAVDHMDEMIEFFRALVGSLMPWNTDGTLKEGKDDKVWFRAIDAFQGFLNMRAPYQSPRLSAVQIVPAGQATAQRTTVNVTILNERGDKVYADSDHAGDDAKLIEHEPSEEEDAA